MPFVVLVVVLALAGCGGSSDNAAPAAGSTTASTVTVDKCKGSADPAVVGRKVAALNRELAQIRALVARIPKRTLNGTPALSRALDRFLVAVRDKDVPVHTRSRLIDRAAGAVSPVCEQCFQALEANRPIAGGAKLGCD